MTSRPWLRHPVGSLALALAATLTACESLVDPSPLAEPPSLTVLPDADASSAVVLGPARFIRGKGKPVTEHVAVTDPDLGGFEPPFTLRVRNGDENGAHRVSAAWIYFDGHLLFGPADFSQHVATLSAEVPLTVSSHMGVRIAGAPGGFLDIWIEGVRRTSDILFTSGDDGSLDVWGIRVDGTGRVNLTAVSHDPDGVHDDVGGKWSPDGSTILFASDKSGVPRKLYLMDADGRNARPLNANAVTELDPYWGADGTKVYYGRNPRFPTTDGAGCAPCPFWELYEYDLLTDQETRLTNNSSRDEHAVASPDGTLLAFRRAERPFDCCNPTSVWIMDIDGGNARRITANNGQYESPFSWDRVSGRILTMWGREVVLMDVDGNAEQLTSGGIPQAGVAFSPDGRTILLGRRDGTYFLDIETRAVTPFLTGPGIQDPSDWNPQGRSLDAAIPASSRSWGTLDRGGALAAAAALPPGTASWDLEACSVAPAADD